MIVEPVSATPRSRRRRIAALAGVVVPVLLLALVIGAALLGQSSPAPPPTLVAVAPAATPKPSPEAATPVPSSATDPLRDGPYFPVDVDGLPVRTVTDVLDQRAAGALDPPTGLVAIAGYLGTPNPRATCPGAGPADPSPADLLSPLCTRESILALERWSLAGSDGFSGIGAHLHVLAPVGVQLPDGIERTTMAASGGPIGVVVFGRFGEPAPDGCRAVTVDCDQGFVLESVAWADGVAVAPHPVIDGGIGDSQPDWLLSNRTAVVRAALGDRPIPLVTALVRPRSLAAFDAVAAAAVRSSTPSGLVWYLRGLATAADGTRWLVWAVVDDVTLHVIASGDAGVAVRVAGDPDVRVPPSP